MAAFLSLIDEPGLFMNALSIPSDPSVGAFGRRVDLLARRSISHAPFSADYMYAERVYMREAPAGFDLEPLAMAFTSNPF
jgi:hypothetical protein